VFTVEIIIGGVQGRRFLRRTVEDTIILTEEQLRIWPKDFLNVLTEAMNEAEKLRREDRPEFRACARARSGTGARACATVRPERPRIGDADGQDRRGSSATNGLERA